MRTPDYYDVGKPSLCTTFASATTVNGAAIDTRGFTHATVLIVFGDCNATGGLTVKCQRGATTTPATDMSGWTTGALTMDATTYDSTIRCIHGPINDVNMDRYMRVTATTTGTTTSLPIAALVVLSNGAVGPVSGDYAQYVTATGT